MKPSVMAAIVENSENGQMGNNLAYSQSSGSDSLHSSESVLDTSNTSTKATDVSPSPKVNGLSHLDDGPQLQKAGANIQCSGTVKVDIPHTLVTCGVTKSEKDFNEKPVAEVDFQPALSLSLPVDNSAPCTKDEEKVKIKVPFDSNSNCSLSVRNSENKISPCDAKESDSEQTDGIKSKILECKTAEQFPSSENTECKEKSSISENETSNKTSTLEDKNLQSDFNDNKLFKSAETISVDSNMDDVYLRDKKTVSSKSTTAYNATLKKDSADMTLVADEKVSEESNSKNYSESSNSKMFSGCQSKTKTAKSSGVSNIPELLAYCSPCRVVVQDFFKELNIDLLELSRNFPVHHGHKKRLKNSKSVQTPIHVEEQIQNNSFDSHNRTKQAKGYTENSKRRKKDLALVSESLNNPVEDDDEDEEDNLPLLSVRNNLTQGGNTAADIGKSGTEEKFKADGNKTTKGENFKQNKGDNSDAVTEERALTNSTSSDVPVTTPINPEAANPFPKTELPHVSPTVNINDSNDLGLKIVSVSSQGSVFFPAFTSDNSENIVFNHLETDSKLNGQLDPTCENSTAKLSPPKCKFHGPNSSPVQNLYKCKKCGLEVKSLRDIQSHMAGSHSEFCMYRCPFCVPPAPVKRISVYNNRPIEFEVLRESSHKLMTNPSSPKTTSSSAVSAKRKMPRHIRIQREKRRKLNYYYRNQREIKNYKNKKMS